MGRDAPALQLGAIAHLPQGELAGGGARDEPFAVVGEAGTDLQVGFAADKKPAINYPVGLVSEQGVQVGRAKAGLGLKGVYYSFTLSNTEGQDFQIDRLEAIVDATTVVKG